MSSGLRPGTDNRYRALRQLEHLAAHRAQQRGGGGPATTRADDEQIGPLAYLCEHPVGPAVLVPRHNTDVGEQLAPAGDCLGYVEQLAVVDDNS